MRSREIVLHVVLPLAAGYEYDEVDERLDLECPDVRHLELPVPPKWITKPWVQARARELRREVEAVGAASY